MFWTPAAGHHKQNLWGALQIETFLAIPVGGEPAGIAVSADGTRAYVTSPEGKMLTVIDASHRKVLRQIKLAGGPLGVETLKVVKEVKVGDGPRAFGRFIREWLTEPAIGARLAPSNPGHAARLAPMDGVAVVRIAPRHHRFIA